MEARTRGLMETLAGKRVAEEIDEPFANKMAAKAATAATRMRDTLQAQEYMDHLIALAEVLSGLTNMVRGEGGPREVEQGLDAAFDAVVAWRLKADKEHAALKKAAGKKG